MSPPGTGGEVAVRRQRGERSGLHPALRATLPQRGRALDGATLRRFIFTQVLSEAENGRGGEALRRDEKEKAFRRDET